VTASVHPRTRGRNPVTGSLVRSAGLQKFRECVAGLGGDAEVYARRAGLPLEALDTDELLIEAPPPHRSIDRRRQTFDRRRQNRSAIGQNMPVDASCPLFRDALGSKTVAAQKGYRMLYG
jgi:hypothetical protein